MKVGTKSLLFGAHQFILHPIYVAKAWRKLYGPIKDWRLYVAFVVHDWGYWGKPDMDGESGQLHPCKGGIIMGQLFDFPKRWSGYRFPPGKAYSWGSFTAYHSRYFAKLNHAKPSMLCAADKLATTLYPTWLYVLLCKLTGEYREYMQLAADYGQPHETITEWAKWIQSHFESEANRLVAEDEDLCE